MPSTDSRLRPTGKHPELAQYHRTQRPTAPFEAADLIAMMRVSPPEHGPGRNAYASVEDAAKVLGLSMPQRQIAERLIRQVAEDARAMVDVAKDANAAGLPRPAVVELLRRGVDLRYKLRKAGPVYTGPKGGKWADPDHTIPWKEGASGGAGKIVPTEGAKTVDRAVADRFSAIREKARQAGVRVKGALKPTHTQAHMDALEKDVDRLIAEKDKLATKQPTKPRAAKPQAEAPPKAKPGAPAESSTAPASTQTQPRTKPPAADQLAGLDAKIPPHVQGAYRKVKALAKEASKTPEGQAWLQRQINALGALAESMPAPPKPKGARPGVPHTKPSKPMVASKPAKPVKRAMAAPPEPEAPPSPKKPASKAKLGVPGAKKPEPAKEAADHTDHTPAKASAEGSRVVANPKSWTEFTRGKMGPYMKQYGGHSGAIGQLGKEWAEYKEKTGIGAKKPGSKRKPKAKPAGPATA